MYRRYLNVRDHSKKLRYTLERLKTIVDRCSNPPHFRGVKFPITELLEPEPSKPPKGARDKKDEKDQKGCLQNCASEKTTKPTGKKRPAHEHSSSFPPRLKRPDLKATVDGKTIASEFQQKLFDDIRHGNCVRCHSKEHVRSTCKEPVSKWEAKFDKDKEKYWLSTLKWQQKASADKTEAKPNPSTKVTTPPTLVQKESRRHTLLPLQSRSQHISELLDQDDDDSEDDLPHPFRSSDAVNYYHFLQLRHPLDSDESENSELTPEELVEAIIESTCMNTIDD
jgi:hypothetical protein